MGKQKILGAALGNCVHVAGVVNFLNLAEELGYETILLGPAISVSQLIKAIKEHDPDLIGVSFRLTPEVGQRILGDLHVQLQQAGLMHKRYAFGCTKPLVGFAKQLGMFEAIFTGEESIETVINYLKGGRLTDGGRAYPQNLLDRLKMKMPYPLLRHHFGLPSLEETVAGVAKIAEAEVLDVISLGLDQNAQEAFFRPWEMRDAYAGAGGVPVRSREDFLRLYQASRCGNFPLMRSYSGTRDLFALAELLLETINNAWCAVPLTWYNVLDGRGPRSVEDAIRENQFLMQWHAERDIPVEVNEAHHWSLRDAPDTVAVTMAFLAAYNAKKMGVRHYIAQYMFNTPPNTSFTMDLAKMLAKLELITSLHDSTFTSFRQVRTGLLSFPVDPCAAKGQLASSICIMMALKPHIVHVVSFSEADHAATPDDVIESCKIAQRVITNALNGLPDLTQDPAVIRRKDELVQEAKMLLEAITLLGEGKADPWSDPETLARAIKVGLLDAPHLKNNPHACGEIKTRMIKGACYTIDAETRRPLTERERIEKIFSRLEREVCRQIV